MQFLRLLALSGALWCGFVLSFAVTGSRASDRPAEPLRQHFVCNTGYTIPDCQRDISALQKVLEKYPVSQLGEWTWVIVRSDDWHAIQAPRNLDPHSPAFTYYPARETFIEEALLTNVRRRSFELRDAWRMTMQELLDYAVAHELAHALCNESDEVKARKAGVLLLEQHRLSCDVTLEARQIHNEAKKLPFRKNN
jgi:hypothetical protein